MKAAAEARSVLAHHFDDLEQQRHAGALGMWVFLATEIMFFGGLFLGYTVYRASYAPAFLDASRHLDLVLGSVNTAILISSSFTMALAVHAAQTGRRRWLLVFLLATAALGLVFLGIKFVEYAHKFEEHLFPGAGFRYPRADILAHAELFFSFYFAMTGLHAAHLVVGVAMLAVLAVMAALGRFSPLYYTPVELGGLYWHFVDIVWIFLFPLLYLL
jgi:cytochrome c oxidase subunit 3